MIANVLNIAFIGLLAFWFSTQGLFTAVLHLILTLLAGAIALACWEPLVYDYLLARMPEMAWSVGLIAPFVLALLLLRWTTDKLVPGNLRIPAIADQIGGGAVGFLSGLITAGFLLIGMNFNAPFGLGDFERYQLDAKGELVHKDSLWLASDQFASSVFTMLSDGALSPAFDTVSLSTHAPDLAATSGAFRLTSRPGARATIMPQHVNVTASVELAADKLDQLADAKPVAGDRLLLINTEHDYEALADLPSDLDKDLYFTASRAQVVLLAQDESGKSTPIMPVGFIYRNEFGSMIGADQFARSRKNPDKDTFGWLFHLPSGSTPRFIRIKQVRLDLPPTEVRSPAQSTQWAQGIIWQQAGPTPDDGTPQTTPDSTGPGADVEGVKIQISNRLPVELSRNWVNTAAQGVELLDTAIVTATGTVKLETNYGLGKNIRLDKIHHDENSVMVQVILTPNKAKSLLGKAFEAGAQTQAPVLQTAKGDLYQASGWIRYNNNEVYLSLTGRRIRAMSEIDTASMTPADTLVLCFLVTPGEHIKAFKIGAASELQVDLPIPK